MSHGFTTTFLGQNNDPNSGHQKENQIQRRRKELLSGKVGKAGTIGTISETVFWAETVTLLVEYLAKDKAINGP